MESFTPQLITKLADELIGTGVFTSRSEFEKRMAEMVQRASIHGFTGEREFSISKVLRGLAAEQGKIVNRDTAEADLNYAKKALSTTTTPGSYLVPTIQASEIIQILSQGGVARSSGARIWDLAGIQKLTVPLATAFPTVEFLGQNSSQVASDPSLGQVSFDLKTRRSLVAVPQELIFASSPAYDVFLTELLGLAFAEHEDSIFFAATAASNGPTPFYATSGTTSVLVGGSANGGNIAYSDILAVLKSAAVAKISGPMAFYMSPRSFFSRILGLLDLQSRPLVVSDPVAAVPYKLFGHPVWISNAIPENLTNGSGSSQSYILFTSPRRCLHIAQSSELSLGVSTERFFELNQVAVRMTQGLDLAAAPASGCIILKGVN